MHSGALFSLQSMNTKYQPGAYSGEGSATMPVVVIKIRKGFSTEQKRRIVQEFTNTLVTVAGVKPELVTIMIDEHELENIGNAGKLRCD